METDTTDTTEVRVRDSQGRVVLKIIDDNVMIMRLPDMDDYCKQELISMFIEFTKGDEEARIKLTKFMNFEDDSGENEFCS